MVHAREDKGHTTLERSTHAGKTALGGERVGVAEERLLGRAVRGRDGVVAGRLRALRVGDDGVALDVKAADLAEGAAGRTRVGDELRNNCDLLGRVDLEVGAGAKEGLVALAERVEVAAILVADTVVALVAITAVGAGTLVEAGLRARMRGVGSLEVLV